MVDFWIKINIIINMARTKGAVSFLSVTLAELNEKFGPSAIIKVSIVQARETGLKGIAEYNTKDNVRAAGDSIASLEVKEVTD